ncbi:MAG: type II secretion system protein N, partial [Sulfuricaulis sp.]|nr:type II secretion system protein N [Sulfuricaulis sp.]
MKKPWLIYLTVGFGFYLVFLVVYVPADWLAWGLSRTTKGIVRIDQPTGSVWSGAGKLMVYYPQTTPNDFGQAQWSINPFWLVTGQLQIHVESATKDAKMQGTLRIGRNHVLFSDLSLSLPAERVGALYSPLALANPQGQFSLRARDLNITASAVEGGAEFLWQNAGSSLSPVNPLGEYKLEMTGQNKTANLKLTTVRGDLDLTGQGKWLILENGLIQFNGTATPRGR